MSTAVLDTVLRLSNVCITLTTTAAVLVKKKKKNQRVTSSSMKKKKTSGETLFIYMNTHTHIYSDDLQYNDTKTMAFDIEENFNQY